MHDAGLHRRAQEGGANDVGQALQAIGHGDRDVLAPSGLEFVEYLEPELGTLGLLNPQAQHDALAVGPHAQGQLHRLVADPAAVRDLDPQPVKEHHRVYRLQRPMLPGSGLGHDLVGDQADEIRGNLGTVALGQERLDLAHAHPSRVRRDDPVVEPGEAPFVLGNQDRRERAIPVAGQLHAHWATLVQQGLAAGAVPLVGLAFRLVLARSISQFRFISAAIVRSITAFWNDKNRSAPRWASSVL